MPLDKNQSSSFAQLIHVFNKKNYDKAENIAKLLSQKWPTQNLSWKIIGSIFRRTNRPLESIDAFKNAVNISPNDAEAYFGLANAYQDLKNFEDAKKNYELAIAIKPKYPEALNNLGITLKELKMFEDSKHNHKCAIDLKPFDPAFHNNLGVVLKLMGEYEKAISSYKKAINILPNYVEAYSNLANAYQSMEMFEESESYRRTALAIDPTDPELYNKLGIALNLCGNREEAITAFKNAISIKPDFTKASINLANIYYDIGMLEESIVNYKNALAFEPSNPVILNGLALALSEHDKKREAIESLHTAIQISPDYAAAHFNLGRIFFDLKNYKKASEHFMQSDTGKAQSYNLRCLFYINKDSFFKEYDKLILKQERNAIVGNLGCVSEIRYRTNRKNIFCHDPLKYIYVEDLKKKYNFQKDIVDPVNAILDEGKLFNRNQNLLVNGIQTYGNIFELKNHTIKKIKKIILLEVKKYRSNFKSSNEGFIKHWPKNYSIYGWLIKMKSGGELYPHMHDTGWITGSIYINIPKKLKPPNGNIAIAVNDSYFPLDNEDVEEMNIDVFTGSMCLFPASLVHCTIPFSSNEDRIVLAFDVIPN